MVMFYLMSANLEKQIKTFEWDQIFSSCSIQLTLSNPLQVTLSSNEVFFWKLLLLQSKEECEYLINLARPHMVKSTVVDSKTGKSKDSRSVHLIVFINPIHMIWF